MLRVLGAPSLDALIAETVPADIRFAGALDLPGARRRVRGAGRAARARGQESGLEVVHRDGLFGLLHAAGHPAQHPGEPRLVHGVHPLPGGDLAGPAGGAAQLPDDGRRPDRPADRQRLDARRGHGGRRGDAHAARPGAGHRRRRSRRHLLVADACHPQTIDIVRTRARPLGIEVVVGDPARRSTSAADKAFGVLLQYPATDGARARLPRPHRARPTQAGALVAMATDLLALTRADAAGRIRGRRRRRQRAALRRAARLRRPARGLLRHPGRVERKLPGRLIGVSKDAQGNRALRLALQTREQHIRRDKATCNICTAQVLLAVMSGMYAVYHGPRRPAAIAERVRRPRRAARRAGSSGSAPRVRAPDLLRHRPRRRQRRRGPRWHAGGRERAGCNLRRLDAASRDHRARRDDHARRRRAPDRRLRADGKAGRARGRAAPAREASLRLRRGARTSAFLTHPVFNTHHTEHEMLRYIKRLEAKDLSLCHVDDLARLLHDEAQRHRARCCRCPGRSSRACILLRRAEQTRGLPRALPRPRALARGDHRLRRGFAAAERRLAGRIRRPARHPRLPRVAAARGTATSASSRRARTAPTRRSAVMGGFQVVPVACDAQGNIDLADLAAKAEAHRERPRRADGHLSLDARRVRGGDQGLCAIVHAHGGQVYMDGANMNAQVGLTPPGHIGADVCHLNLHKTFCIPHGGGGPGMGPIGVAAAPRALSARPSVARRGAGRSRSRPGAVSAAPWGSASILAHLLDVHPDDGPRRAHAAPRSIAILNANYVAQRLDAFFPVALPRRHGARRARVHRRPAAR